MSPIAPFFADRLFRDLNAVTGRDGSLSVHLADFPPYDASKVDKALEERMELAQKICSMGLRCANVPGSGYVSRFRAS